jgi:hypothetical protein
MGKLQAGKRYTNKYQRSWKNSRLRSGISGKTPACEQEHYLIQKDSVRIPGWEREYPGKLQAL